MDKATALSLGPGARVMHNVTKNTYIVTEVVRDEDYSFPRARFDGFPTHYSLKDYGVVGKSVKSDLKPGDKVKCILSGLSTLIKGNIYTVSRVEPNYWDNHIARGGDGIFLEEVTGHDNLPFFEYRFELVEEKSSQDLHAVLESAVDKVLDYSNHKSLRNDLIEEIKATLNHNYNLI